MREADASLWRDTIGIMLDEHGWADVDTATDVGRHHGAPVVYEVQAGRMWLDRYPFYRSVNGVWLTREVPVSYLVKR